MEKLRNASIPIPLSQVSLSIYPLFSGGTGTRFVNYFAGNPQIGTSHDFTTVATATYLGRTDQAFITRNELIKLQQEAGFGAGALQHLGTFSRERNAPTWRAGTASITQRFYIGHLNLVKPNPPAARNADIQKYFGLRWVDGTAGTVSPPTPAVPGHWQYVGSSGGAMQNRIPGFTTDPEFFQLLNYAINRTNGDDPAHILATLSLGAALIDQYDDDTAGDPLTGTTTTMIEYGGGWAVGLENTDPARPSPSASPFPPPAGMSPTPPPAIPTYVMLNRPFRNVGEFGYAFRAAAVSNPDPLAKSQDTRLLFCDQSRRAHPRPVYLQQRACSIGHREFEHAKRCGCDRDPDRSFSDRAKYRAGAQPFTRRQPRRENRGDKYRECDDDSSRAQPGRRHAPEQRHHQSTFHHERRNKGNDCPGARRSHSDTDVGTLR